MAVYKIHDWSQMKFTDYIMTVGETCNLCNIQQKQQDVVYVLGVCVWLKAVLFSGLLENLNTSQYGTQNCP